MSHTPQNPVRPAWSKPSRGGRRQSLLGEKETVTVEEKLQRIMGRVLGVEEDGLVSSVRLVDLGADSLDAVEISVRCEDVFGIEFSEDFAAEGLETFGAWLRVVRRMVQRRVGERCQGLSG